MRTPQLLFAVVVVFAGGLSPAPSRAQEGPRESDPADVLYRTAQLLEAEGELDLCASRIDLGGSGSERGSEAGGSEWTLGGPLFTRPVRGPNGDYRTAVSLTLLSGRF